MNSKKAQEIADMSCKLFCIVAMIGGLISAILGHLPLTIFWSAIVIAMALQPDGLVE